MQVRLRSLALLKHLLPIDALSNASRQAIEGAVEQQLRIAIKTVDLDGQNILLQILEESLLRPYQPEADGFISTQVSLDKLRSPKPSIADSTRRISISDANTSTLLQLVLQGLTTATNKHIVHLWIDFVLNTAPHYRKGLKPLIFPITDAICRELDKAIREVVEGASSSDCSVSELAVRSYITAIEQLVHIALAKPTSAGSSSTKSPQETAGLFGYVSTVFYAENNATISQGDTVCDISAHTLERAADMTYLVHIASFCGFADRYTSVRGSNACLDFYCSDLR